jgi:hypothetical protein
MFARQLLPLSWLLGGVSCGSREGGGWQTWSKLSNDLINVFGFDTVHDEVTGSGDEVAILQY